MKGNIPLRGEIKATLHKPACIIIAFAPVCLLLGNVSKVREVVYRPLVLIWKDQSKKDSTYRYSV